MASSSSIVFKVKFGKTPKYCFNASINEKKLDLDIVMLREKIRGRFSFGSDVEFTMTYVDEDGDVVSLTDDDDLHVVVSQSLNPVRITVNLNGSNCNGSSGNSTPLRSQKTLKSRVAKILKSLPEPFRDALAKLLLDLASKASSTTAVAELVEKNKDLLASILSKVPSATPAVVELVENNKDLLASIFSKASSATPAVVELVEKNKDLLASILSKASSTAPAVAELVEIALTLCKNL